MTALCIVSCRVRHTESVVNSSKLGKHGKKLTATVAHGSIQSNTKTLAITKFLFLLYRTLHLNTQCDCGPGASELNTACLFSLKEAAPLLL